MQRKDKTDKPETAGRGAPSSGARMVVWGGVLLGVAGLTAGTIMATRKIAALIADEDDIRPRYHVAPQQGRAPQTLAPRFATLDDEAREQVRRRARAQARADSRLAAQRRAAAARRRHPPAKAGLSDMTRTAGDLIAGVDRLAESLTGAFHGFRGVASQAGTIIGDFARTAEQIRGLMGQNPDPQGDKTGERRENSGPRG